MIMMPFVMMMMTTMVVLASVGLYAQYGLVPFRVLKLKIEEQIHFYDSVKHLNCSIGMF